MAESKTLRMELGKDSYDIVIERGALQKAGKYLDLDRKVLVLTDDGVPAAYAKTVSDQAKKGFVFTVPQGEDSKSIPQFSDILSEMLKHGFSRKDAVVAVGGGVVGDLAGFVASAYMRGIDFYNIPTTVLSQVDSSIGGKTAVNLDGIKNIVGAFYQPKKVLVDLDLLDTLDQRLVSEGLAEALKMGLTSDKKLFELFEKGNINGNMDEIILRSLMVKKAVVEQDEKEQGLRKILNFGHTIGHGVESCGGLYHGECVAVGMIPMVSEELRPRLIKALESLRLPTCAAADPERIIEAVKHDKKSMGDTVTAVTVPAPGHFEMKEISFKELYPLIETISK